MPELPEVENFARQLHQYCVNKKIEKIFFHRSNLRYPLDKDALKKIFAYQTHFVRCYRIAKQLVIETTGGSVSVGLGMTGSFHPVSLDCRLPHQHITLSFTDGTAIAYIDPRRFGFWNPGKVGINKNVTDPLSQNELKQLFFSPEIQGKSRSIKEMLMDQELIGGIGNIYAAEALYRAKISPFTPCFRISPKQWKTLAEHLPLLLNKAIELGGSSISTYRLLHGVKGEFQNLHQVYGRHGEKCLAKGCSGIIEKESQGGRSTWFCPLCQRSQT